MAVGVWGNLGDNPHMCHLRRRSSVPGPKPNPQHNRMDARSTDHQDSDQAAGIAHYNLVSSRTEEKHPQYDVFV